MNKTIEPQKRRGRPPKGSSTQNETKKKLIRSGLELLTEKGFSATCLDEILRKEGIPKGSFYHYFTSKDAFCAELIDNYAAYFARRLAYFLEDETLSPLERIVAFGQDAESKMARYNYRRGCLVGNLGQEITTLPEGSRAKLKAVFNDWQNRLADCLRQAQSAGQVPGSVDVVRMSNVFWTGWEGAVMIAKLEQRPEPLRYFLDFYLRGLKADSPH